MYVQAARERDRLSALEGVLTQAWQADISARVSEATIPLKQEIATATEELAALRQEISVLKTRRPDPSPGRQGGSETHQPAIAAANPPTTVGVATLSPAEALPPLNKSLLFSNVTLTALQAAGIPVPSMETAPQFSANPQASGTAAGASREGSSAGPVHLDGDLPSQNFTGGEPRPQGGFRRRGEWTTKKVQTQSEGAEGSPSQRRKG